MAQLPPKVPSIPSFFHKNPVMATFFPPAAPTTHPSWVDDFLDFSAAKRGAHRRSMSDFITFLESPEATDFDRLDADQLLSMFPDQAAPQPPEADAAPASSNNSSTPSDNCSVNEEKPCGDELSLHAESEEAQSECKSGPTPPPSAAAASDQQAQAAAAATSHEQIVDPKRVKRILANRQSAQRSRVRKLQYISELERSVTTLQTEVSALSPRVAFLDHQRSILTVGNNNLKQRIAALAQDKIFKDAHQESLRKEIERLRQVYHQQSLNKMEVAAAEKGRKELLS